MADKLSVGACIGFSAAHRIAGHYKCSNLHGHNYKVCVEVEEKYPMEIDLDKLFKILQEKIYDTLDHTFLNESLCKAMNVEHCPTSKVLSENIAEYALHLLKENFGDRAYVVKVWETPNLYVKLKYKPEED